MKNDKNAETEKVTTLDDLRCEHGNLSCCEECAKEELITITEETNLKCFACGVRMNCVFASGNFTAIKFWGKTYSLFDCPECGILIGKRKE